MLSTRRSLRTSAVLMVAAALATGLAVAGIAPVVASADTGLDPVSCQANPSAPSCRIDVSTSEGSGAAGSVVVRCHDVLRQPAPCYYPEFGWAYSDGCYYRPAGPEWVAALGVPTPPRVWYEGTCIDTATTVIILTRLRLFAVPPMQAALLARAVGLLRLPTPTIRVNPAPPAAQLVFVPTWLWIEPVAWTARSATAAVPGLSVTATATPIRVVWSTGDGATLTCRVPGTPWRPGTDPMLASPDCGHTYTHASTGPALLTATITWAVSWVGGGAGGTEPALTSTASLRLPVIEAQALTTTMGDQP
jgi:hypothetical protein